MDTHIFLLTAVYLSGQLTTVHTGGVHVRLANGKKYYEGRVEVWDGKHWGTICDDSWDVRDATVVCRQLGLNSTSAIPWGWAHFGVGVSGPLLMTDIDCKGKEESLFDCSSPGLGHVGDCNRYEEAGVTCGGTFEMRLVNGSHPREGRVEVRVNGVWGTICDDQWDAADAAVVCRQLDFRSKKARALKKSHFGKGRGPVFMGHVHCEGGEVSLLDCPTADGTFADWQSYCNHGEDAGVSCGCKCHFLSICLVRLSL